MRYILTTKVDPESRMAPSPELMAALATLSEELIKAGVLLEQGGIQAIESGTTLTLSGGKVTATDGPFTEANEVVGGFAIVEVKSKEEAVELARRFLAVHAKVLGPSYFTENLLRRMYLPSDFAADGGSK